MSTTRGRTSTGSRRATVSGAAAAAAARSGTPPLPPIDEVVARAMAMRTWTDEHLKLLYLLSRYTRPSSSSVETETWIRKLPLLVLIYEGIVAGVFDCDYAPAIEPFGPRLIFLNVSQEGRDDIDDLREGNLINGLKLSSREYQSITAYQISAAGLSMLQHVTPEMREQVDALIYVPGQAKSPDTLLEVSFDEENEQFLLQSRSRDYIRRSSVSDCEDVSYVSSPYLPACVRSDRTTRLSSNAHRAQESVLGSSNIRDVELNEVILLDDVRLIIGEYIPCGSNQIVALNDRLGASERVQGGLFTAFIDEDPEGTQFEVSPGLTKVAILDWALSRYLNFEAEVYFPEEENIKQIEHFGVHTRDDGSVFSGLRIESIMDRVRKDISLDLLARLIWTMHQDSSSILDSLISSYQRNLLDMMYLGHSTNRHKFALVMARAIRPRLRAEFYLDKEDNENELRQILGDVYSAHDLGDDLLILGRNGVLFVSEQCEKREPLLLAFLAVQAREIFINELFHRIFALAEMLKDIRKTIDEYQNDPNSIPQIRHLLSRTSKDVIHLQEILGYLGESIEQLHVPAAPTDPTGQAMMQLFDLNQSHKTLKRRVYDLQKNVAGAQSELVGLREMSDVISETAMFRLQEGMEAHTKNLEDVFRSNERASSSLEILQVILSGSLAFEILDRLTGDWTVTTQPWAKYYIVEPLMNKPFAWFGINLLLWAVIGVALIQLMTWLTDHAAGVFSLRIKLNRPINLPALQAFLAQRNVSTEDLDADDETSITTVKFTELPHKAWNGPPPLVSLVYDGRHAFLMKMFLQLSRRHSRLSADAIEKTFLQLLEEAGVFAKHRISDSQGVRSGNIRHHRTTTRHNSSFTSTASRSTSVSTAGLSSVRDDGPSLATSSSASSSRTRVSASASSASLFSDQSSLLPVPVPERRAESRVSFASGTSMASTASAFVPTPLGKTRSLTSSTRSMSKTLARATDSNRPMYDPMVRRSSKRLPTLTSPISLSRQDSGTSLTSPISLSRQDSGMSLTSSVSASSSRHGDESGDGDDTKTVLPPPVDLVTKKNQ